MIAGYAHKRDLGPIQGEPTQTKGGLLGPIRTYWSG